MIRRALALAVLMLGALVLGPSAAAARTRLDARVDAIPAARLLSSTATALVDESRQRRARAIADIRHVASAGWGIAQIFTFWWFWRSGNAARLRDWMRRRTRRRWAHRAVFGAALGALGPLVAIPFAGASYRVTFNAGLTEERLPQWLLEYAVRIVLDAALGALVVAGVLGLVERVRVWYVLVAAALVAGALAGVMLEPVLPAGGAHKPVPAVVLRAQEAVAQAVGVPGTPVVMTAQSRHSVTMTARAAGIGPTARAFVGDTTVAKMTPPELRYVLATIDAHVRYGDPLRQTLFGVLLFVLSTAVAVLLSDRVGFRRDDDALSRLALVATFLGLVLVFTYPAYNAFGRNVQTRADGIAVAAIGERGEAIRALVRTADDDLVPLCDRRSIRWYFEDRPPLAGRIAAISGAADPCPGGGAATRR